MPRRVVTDKAAGIEELHVIKWGDDHFEAKWQREGRAFAMFFDPLKMEAKGGTIEWRYARGESNHRGTWSLGFASARKMVPTVFRLIRDAKLINSAVTEHLREVVTGEAQEHRKKARQANALEMYSALQTIQKLAGFGRVKGEAFGLNERERMEILQIATAVVTKVDTWRESTP